MSEVVKRRPGYVRMILPTMYGDTTATLFHHEDDTQKLQSFVLMVKGPWNGDWDTIFSICEDLDEIRSVLNELGEEEGNEGSD